MSAVFMLVSITLSPNKPFLKLSCDHQRRVSMCLIRPTQDLFVVPLALDESEWISGLPVKRQMFQLHTFQAARHQHSSSASHVRRVEFRLTR